MSNPSLQASQAFTLGESDLFEIADILRTARGVKYVGAKDYAVADEIVSLVNGHPRNTGLTPPQNAPDGAAGWSDVATAPESVEVWGFRPAPEGMPPLYGEVELVELADGEWFRAADGARITAPTLWAFTNKPPHPWDEWHLHKDPAKRSRNASSLKKSETKERGGNDLAYPLEP